MSLRMLLSAVSSETGQQGPFMRREGYWMSCVESAQKSSFSRESTYSYTGSALSRSIVRLSFRTAISSGLRLETFFTAPGTSVA